MSSSSGRKVAKIVQQITEDLPPASIYENGDTKFQKAEIQNQDENEEMKIALYSSFPTLNDKEDGYLPLENLTEALSLCNVNLPGYKSRVLLDSLRQSHPDNKINAEDFWELHSMLRGDYDSGAAYTNGLTKLNETNVRTVQSGVLGNETSVHSVSAQEQLAFSSWVEQQLKRDPECAAYFPFTLDGNDLYEKCSDGVLLCKIINLAQPNTIVEKAINRPTVPDRPLSVYQKLENLRLAVNSARAIGCSIVNIGPDDLLKAREHLLLGLVWQIIKIGLTRAISVSIRGRGDIAWMMSQVRRDTTATQASITSRNGSTTDADTDWSASQSASSANDDVLVSLRSAAKHNSKLQRNGISEPLETELRKLTPEQIIINWVNYHLQKAGSKRTMSNFGEDLRDSEIYIVLLSQIAPRGISIDATALRNVSDLRKRAQIVIKEATRFDAATFITPDSVVERNAKLNLAFLANLFNTNPAIDPSRQNAQLQSQAQVQNQNQTQPQAHQLMQKQVQFQANSPRQAQTTPVLSQTPAQAEIQKPQKIQQSSDVNMSLTAKQDLDGQVEASIVKVQLTSTVSAKSQNQLPAKNDAVLSQNKTAGKLEKTQKEKTAEKEIQPKLQYKVQIQNQQPQPQPQSVSNNAPVLNDDEETHEERTLSNWINSLGVKPQVQCLYTDLRDGLILFQLFEIIKPGIVDRTKVHERFHPRRRFIEELENCNYAVELAKDQMKFVLVGIAGEDLHSGNVTLTLGVVWQAMRAYTLAMLENLMRKSGFANQTLEKDIMEWANTKLRNAGKKGFTGFLDFDLADGRILLDLIEAIRPTSVQSDWVKTGYGAEDKMANAQLAITLGRKIGANIYALPEDIVEVQPKMMLTIFASLMVIDLESQQSDFEQSVL